MSVKFHEAYVLDSQQDQLLWWDDFLGDQLQDEWDSTGVGTNAVVDQQTGGIVRVTTGAVQFNTQTLDWNDIRSLHVDQRVSMETRVKLGQATFIRPQLRLMFDNANNYIAFYARENAGGATNWIIYCVDGGAVTNGDTGIAIDTSYHIFRIECHIHGSNHVHFYIDGTQTANSPITTNIPDDATDYLQPNFRLTTEENLAKSIDVDYCVVRQEI